MQIESARIIPQKQQQKRVAINELITARPQFPEHRLHYQTHGIIVNSFLVYVFTVGSFYCNRLSNKTEFTTEICC